MSGKFALWQVVHAITFSAKKHEKIKLPMDIKPLDIFTGDKYKNIYPEDSSGGGSGKGANKTHKERD